MTLRAPFQWHGGKRRVAEVVWAGLGDVSTYVEPFAGSLAVLLARPDHHRRPVEIVSDLDGMVANFWRALKDAPDKVAHHADHPVSHVDVAARHVALNDARPLLEQLLADPEYYDPQIAGYWVYCLSAFISGGFCDGTETRRQLSEHGDISHRRPHFLQRGISSIGTTLDTTQERTTNINDTMQQLADRLRNVQIWHATWNRYLRGPLTKGTRNGIFLDPPYDPTTLATPGDLYSGYHSATISQEVRQWALEHGDNPRNRIILAGYEDEHGPHMPDTWHMHAWSSSGNQVTPNSKSGETRHKERLWFSPHCNKPTNTLF